MVQSNDFGVDAQQRNKSIERVIVGVLVQIRNQASEIVPDEVSEGENNKEVNKSDTEQVKSPLHS